MGTRESLIFTDATTLGEIADLSKDADQVRKMEIMAALYKVIRPASIRVEPNAHVAAQPHIRLLPKDVA